MTASPPFRPITAIIGQFHSPSIRVTHDIRQKFAYTLLGAGIMLVGTIISPLTANDADPDAREVILFHGLPIVKLQADGTAENPHRLESMLEHQKKEYECVIVKKGDKYYWKSRDNRELKKEGRRDLHHFPSCGRSSRLC